MFAARRLGSRGSNMLSSGESRIPSVESPRGIDDHVTLEGLKGGKTTKLDDSPGGKSGTGEPQRSGYGAGTPAAAAIGPHGWLWRCENPFKALTVPDTPLQCCAFAKGESAKLAIGTAAGWLAVVNLAGEDMEETTVSRFFVACNSCRIWFMNTGYGRDGACADAADIHLCKLFAFDARHNPTASQHSADSGQSLST